ncbi:MAG: hypothetical protein J1E58_03320 [Prevotella sp.]|nr:hypothetical protein [Prevotella sp.]
MKTTFALVIALCATLGCNAQTLDDVGKIVIGFHVPETSSRETQELKDYLSNKVSHWIAQAGYSSNGISPLYLYPDISIDSEDVAEGGMKNVYVITGTLFLKIVQNERNVVFSSVSLPFRDSSTKKITAIKNGIGNLQYNKILPLLDEAKEKILKYYESEKNTIFAKAELMCRRGEYEGAIAHLMSIPSCLTSIHQEALEKADEILNMKVKAYNDSILILANSYLANHDARSSLDVLSSYQDATETQNAAYRQVLTKAEKLVTAAELTAAKEKRQRYLDQKEREHHQWAVEDEERRHRMDMDNQQMAYNRAALAANERLTSQRIASNERLTSQRINAIKTIAANYYQNNQSRTVIVKHQY